MVRQDPLVLQGAHTVRSYVDADEPSWLRCRVLGFLHTDYFDDVLTAKPRYDGDSIELVAVSSQEVIGVLDVALNGDLATIETVVVHPDAARRGIASELLDEALRLLPPDIRTVDAWTRQTPAANAWYLASGFRETYRYLHVYARSDSEIASAIPDPRDDLRPVAAFFHAEADQEEALRQAFDRVYVCRRYERPPKHEPPSAG